MTLSSQDEEVVAVETDARPAPVTAARHARTPLVARFLPSFTDLAFLMPIVVLLRMGGPRLLLGDGDTGWHLRAGEWMLANGRVPDRDIFSFTMPGRPWFAWEWLWELVFGWLHSHWGMAAVLFGSTLVIAATSALLYRLVLRTSGNPVIAIAVSLVACFATSIHWLARPHLFTLLFVVIFCSLIQRAESGKTRALLWLPALMVVWTNLHGGFIAGLVLTAAYCAGDLVLWAVDPRPGVRKEALVRARRYAMVTLACAAATFVNPYGYQLHVHIFRYLTDPFMVRNIVEFLPLNFRHPVGIYVEALILLGAVCSAWDCYCRRFAFPLLFVAWTHMALLSVRHAPVLVILTAPAVARGLVGLVEYLREPETAAWLHRFANGIRHIGAEVGDTERIGRIPVLSAALALALLLLLRAQPSETFRAEYDAKMYPVGAVPLLSRPEFRTGVFTLDTWGGFLAYRLYPDFKTFSDGRSDFYGEKFDQKYVDVMNCKYDWQETLDRYRVHTAVLPVDSPLAGTLRESIRWRPVYDDGISIVFRKVAAAASIASVAVPVPALSEGGIPAITGSRTPTPVIPTDHYNPTRGE